MAIIIRDAKVFHLRAQTGRAVVNAFGTINDRQAIFVALQDEDGRWGYGESWVNFPAWSPWERRAAMREAYFPYLLRNPVETVTGFMARMVRAFIGPAVQAGSVGPMLSALCGVEMALWELEGKRKAVGLSELWFTAPAREVAVYGSGINPPLPLQDIDAMLDIGVGLFKLKLGFGEEDLKNLDALLKHVGDRARVAVDLNRGWRFEEAVRWLPMLAERRVRWLEEPLVPRDQGRYAELKELAAGKVEIAAGENVWLQMGVGVGPMETMAVDILQPDVTKNCGVSLALELIRNQPAGKTIVPHFLGSGVGQAASLHLAAGCPAGLVEWDINPNPLRTQTMRPGFEIRGGKIEVPRQAGLAWEVDAGAMERYSVE